jgi:DNA-binding transcriptional MerR regulator
MSTSPDSQLYTAAAAADQLHVSPDTLRRWTKEFAAQLSATAVGAGYYRYSGADIKRLQIVRDLLSAGKTANEIARQLSPHEPEAPPPADDYHEAADKMAATDSDNGAEPVSEPARQGGSQSSVVLQGTDAAAREPAMVVLREVLTGFGAGQEAILNSQQVNRNLMGVVIQDNFNLKEENARLRDRMLKLEQDLNELRRVQAEQRQFVEMRMRQVEQKKDWFSRLLGF